MSSPTGLEATRNGRRWFHQKVSSGMKCRCHTGVDVPSYGVLIG
jgi:hypothetical protein